MADNAGTKGLHLMDSQFYLGAIAHGRSPSGALAPVLEKIGALALGGSVVQLIDYTTTNQNPADRGSRNSDA